LADDLGMWNSPRGYPAAVIALRRPAGLAGLAGLTALVMAACVYDPDRRCGAAQMYSESAQVCVCEGNAITVPGGCKPCAADEVVTGMTCGCAIGQKKNADGACAVVNGLGDPCDTVTAPCNDTTYSYCAVQDGGTSGICTQTCAGNADCEATYTCATWEAQPYCRTFTGVGQTCGASTDCTGDANFCDTFMTHSCLVSGCSLTANDCPRDTMCCDFSRFRLGTLCAGACP
jgi:hypothetical protein